MQNTAASVFPAFSWNRKKILQTDKPQIASFLYYIGHLPDMQTQYGKEVS